MTSDVGEDEAALLDKTTGNYIGLDPVATSIWRLLAQPRDLAELVAGIVAEYEVDEQRAQDDILSFLKLLETAELVKVTTD
jgi:hypothetical protein